MEYTKMEESCSSQSLLSAAASTLSTCSTMTTVILEPDFGTRSMTPLLEMTSSDPAPTRFYIGDRTDSNPELNASGSVTSSGSFRSPKKSRIINLDEDDESLVSAATALMSESTKRMSSGKGSFDSGYGIVIGTGINGCGNSGRGFITCDSEAAIILNPELDPELGRTLKDNDSGVVDADHHITNGTMGPTKLSTVIWQVFIAIMVSSAGNFFAGMILDHNQSWEVFSRIPELYYLVPTLLGLKGNLEMTMVARLSTQANLGGLNTWRKAMKVMAHNCALIQCQATVISILASAVTFVISHFDTQGAALIVAGEHSLSSKVEDWQLNSVGGENVVGGSADVWTKILVIFATSLATANIACLGSSVLMILLIIYCTNHKYNPDNFATAVAASVGDVVTSLLLTSIGQGIFLMTVATGGAVVVGQVANINQDLSSPWIAVGIISFCLVTFPAVAYVACSAKDTRKVLLGFDAWGPILIAMGISFLSGTMLRYGATMYAFMTLFQPLINGVGGNLAAITSSRMSTELHLLYKQRSASDSSSQKSFRSFASSLANTLKSFILYKDQQNILLVVFLGISVIVQLVYGYLLPLPGGNGDYISVLFYVLYCLVSTAQVLILLISARFLVHAAMSLGMDPDTSAIPILTSIGDFLGTFFLMGIFAWLRSVGDSSAMAPIMGAEGATVEKVITTLAATLAPPTTMGVTYTNMAMTALPTTLASVIRH